jgi:hypothetical protein
MSQQTLNPVHGAKPMSNQTWKLAENIGVEQAQAMDEVLALLDAAVPSKFIALLGSRNSASVLINDVLGKNLLRTPAHRKLISIVIDATRIPTHIEAWQHMLFCVMDKLSEASNLRRNSISDLRDELNELVQLERKGADSAGLASAAFAHHFKTAFAGIVNSTVSTSNSLLVVGIDKLDQVDGFLSLDLLEASRYFLTAPDCAVLIAADEQPLLDKLATTSPNGAKIMASWPSERVIVPERLITRTGKAPLRPGATGTASPRGKRANLGTLPSESAKVVKELLEPDQKMIDAACDDWHRAIERLNKRNEEGFTTKIGGTHVAKLVALKMLSPRLFDAAKFDAALLSRLERAARSGNADMKDEHQRLMALAPNLTALFKSAPNFVGLETRDIATALRLVYGRETEAPLAPVLNKTSMATAGVAIEHGAAATHGGAKSIVGIDLDPQRVTTRTEQLRQQGAAVKLSLPPVGLLLAGGAAIVALDRLTKAASEAQAVLPNLTNSSIIGNAAMLGMELIGIALSLLILAFWGVSKRNGLYHGAFGLIIGGLGSNLYDHIMTGGVLNFLPIGGIAVNLAHLALLAGALMLMVSWFQRDDAEASAH